MSASSIEKIVQLDGIMSIVSLHVDGFVTHLVSVTDELGAFTSGTVGTSTVDAFRTGSGSRPCQRSVC
jgi:hypothetical protein